LIRDKSANEEWVKVKKKNTARHEPSESPRESRLNKSRTCSEENQGDFHRNRFITRKNSYKSVEKRVIAARRKSRKTIKDQDGRILFNKI
jgi:hypothetical protein